MDSAWINSSCFYPMNAWSKLLNEISHLLQNIENLEAYDFEMNNQFGENIRLSLMVPKAVHKDVIILVDKRLTFFFDAHFLPSVNSEKEPEKIPFPTSIIQFDLYSKFMDADDYIESSHSLSECILYGLLDEDITHDTIVSLSCYLHLCLLNVCLKFTDIKIWNEEFLETYKSIGSEKFIDKNSKTQIDEIFSEIQDDETLKCSCEWLYNWKHKLIKELSSLTRNLSGSELTKVVKGYISMYFFLIKIKLNVSISVIQVTQILLANFCKKFAESSNPKEIDI